MRGQNMKRLLIRLVFLIIFSGLAFGCAKIAWKQVTLSDTINDYEGFLERYPEGELSDQARKKLEILYFEEAAAKGTISAYEAFLGRYPQSEFSDEIRKKQKILYFEKADRTRTISPGIISCLFSSMG